MHSQSRLPVPVSSVDRLTLPQLLNPCPLIVFPTQSVAAVIAQMALASQRLWQAGPAAADSSPRSSGFALVVENGNLQGIFTERDAVSLVVAGVDLAQARVVDAMSPPTMTLQLTDAEDVSVVLAQLHQHPLDVLPILDQQNGLVGVVTQTDVLQALSALEWNPGELDPIELDQAVETAMGSSSQPETDCYQTRAQVDPSQAKDLGSIAEIDIHSYQTAILDQICTAIIATDLEGRMIYWNQSAQKLYQLTPEAMGRSISLLVPPEQEAAAAAILASTLTHGRWGGEFLAQQQNGKRFLAHGMNILIQDAAGNPCSIVRTSVNITEYQQADLALQENQRLVQKLINAIPGTLYIYDCIEQRNVYCNREIEILLGYSLEEIQQMESTVISRLIHPDDMAKLEAHWQHLEALEDGISLDLEYRIRHASGEWRWHYSRDTVFARTADKKLKQVLGTAIDITSRKQAEASLWELNQELEQRVQQRTQQLEQSQTLLRQREQVFRTLVENSPDVIARHDRQLRHRYVNPAIAQEAEYPPEAFMGRTCAEIGFPSDLANLWDTNLRQVFVTRTMRCVEFSYDNSQGKQFYQTRFAPEFDLEGNVESVLSISRNVSDIKRVEMALRESEARLRLAFEVAGMGAWDWNPNTGEEVLSPETEQIYGFAPRTFDGRLESLVARVHPEERHLIGDLYGSTSQDGIQHKEFRIVLPDGTVRWIVSKGKIFYDEQGHPVRMIGVDLDITERKLADDAIRDSQQKLATLMSNLPGIAYSCQNDPSWTMNFLSEGCFELTGYRPDQLIDNASLCFSDIIHPDDRQMVWDTIQAAIACRQSFEIMYRIITATAQERWVWEQGCGLFADTGQLLLLEGFITDISQRKHAEERLKESLQEKEVLLREIHHRVKNNLQMVSSLLSLQAGAVTNPQVLAALEDSQKRVEAMTLIHQKLYLSNNLAKINFGEYAHSLIQDLFQSYSHGRISLRLALADLELPIEAAMACGLIINELFSNAVKYAFPDGLEGEISIAFACTVPGTCVLTVADNGVGVPTGVDFRTTRSLGLRLVDALTRKLHGSIKLGRVNGTSIQITFHQP